MQSTDKFQCKSQQKIFFLLLKKKTVRSKANQTRSALEGRQGDQSTEKRDNSFGQHIMVSIK